MKYCLIALTFLSLNVFADSETVKGARKDAAVVFKQQMQVRLDQLDEKIEELKRQGQSRKSQAVQDLENARAKIQAQLSEAADTGKQGWQRWKRNLSKSVEDLNRRVQDVLRE